MDGNYIIYRCKTCGTEFIIPKEFIDYNNNYITCPIHGKHSNVIVIGACDQIKDCMKARKYKRVKGGAIVQID